MEVKLVNGLNTTLPMKGLDSLSNIGGFPEKRSVNVSQKFNVGTDGCMKE